MNNELKIAGLSERDVNERLCAWPSVKSGWHSSDPPRWHLWEKTSDEPHRFFRDLLFRPHSSAVGSFVVCYHEAYAVEAVYCLPFTRSHDSIARVLDVMDAMERDKWAMCLCQLAENDPECPFGVLPAWHALFATPRQKCEAALIALGLGANDANSD